MTANHGALLLARRRLHEAIWRGVDRFAKVLGIAIVVVGAATVFGLAAAWVFVEHPVAFAVVLVAVALGGVAYGLALWRGYRRVMQEVEQDAG